MAAVGNVPRAEYPRPQFRREEWLCLNGTWSFVFDDGDVGLGADWVERLTQAAPEGRIVVPFPYQAALSGIGDRAVHSVVWYRRAFHCPAAWRGRRVLLHVGAAGVRTEVWLHGHLLGGHEGG